MYEILPVAPEDEPDSIVLQTRKGTRIRNKQSPEPSSFYKRIMDQFEHKYPMIRKVVNKRSGFYNCHGLVFASRRSSIEESEQIWQILDEDGYVEVQIGDSLPGDIIVYLKDGSIDHTAIVIKAPEPPLFIPDVLAKIAHGPEIIGPANACPEYNLNGAKVFRISK